MTPRERRGRPAGPRGSGPPRGRSGPARPPEIDPARHAALELLTAVRVRDAYANLALPAILRRHRLHGRDAALATELGYGTLRAPGLLDAVIDECTDRPLARVEPTLLDALRLGAYQLLRTRVPPHAAVDTTVELVRVEAGSRGAGFVNAVLRRVGERDEKAWVQQLAPDAVEDPLGHAAFAHAHPRWIAQAFADALGAATRASWTTRWPPTTPAPPCTCWPGPARSRPRSWPLVTGGTEAPYSPYGVHLGRRRRPGRARRRGRGAGRGAGRGQPAGGPRAHAGARWSAPTAAAGWTSAPGPGGKAVLLGSLARRSTAAHGRRGGAQRAPRRAGRAAPPRPAGGRAHRGRPGRPRLPDGALRPGAGGRPCTGLGALRRRPEARWRRRPDDVAALTKLQRELLAAALRRSAPAGWSPTSPARRTWPRPAGCSPPCCARTGDRGAARRPPAAARGAAPRRRPDGAALAAPARHRRDVPRPAAATGPRTGRDRLRRLPARASVIAPSLLSADFARLGEEARIVGGVPGRAPTGCTWT